MLNLPKNSSRKPVWLLHAKIDQAKAKTQLKKSRLLSEQHWDFRGHNASIQHDETPELLLVGAAGTGKTLAILSKINRAMWDYPGARALIVRKVRADLAQSTLVTFERDVLGLDNPICSTVQREHRSTYRYPNGSEIVVGGMDRPGRILSAEYDMIYVAEAVQLDLEDWETLVMRNRNGVMPYQQVIGDTNPDRPDHWLKQRCDAGLTKLLNTYHEDNPALWDGERWTARGTDYVLDKLARLTGVRRLRFKDGLWVVAEGAVYDAYDERIHVIDRATFERISVIKRFRSIDFGYNNAFVCQWWAVDEDDRMYLYREIYHTKRLVQDHAAQINELSDGETIRHTVADHDAEDRATLKRYGIRTMAAEKSVSVGIQAVQSRMRVQGDGKPTIYFVRDARVELDDELRTDGLPTSSIEEIAGYVWNDKSKKDTPQKSDDHGMDAMRYAVMYVDGKRSKKAQSTGKNLFDM